MKQLLQKMISFNTLLKGRFFSFILIITLGILAYSNTFNGPFHFDDNQNIIENPLLRDLSYFSDPSKTEEFKGTFQYNAYRQRYTGFLTFALNYKLHGLDVKGFHIANLAIHLITSLLVYFLVILTFRSPGIQQTTNKSPHSPFTPWRTSNKGGDKGELIALFSALLFVAHPLQTQAVTYIVQRLASLATLFYLLSLVLYIRARLSTTSALTATCYVVSLISAILAMKTKEMTFTLPVTIALYEFMFFRDKISRRALFLIPILLTMFILPFTLIGIDKPLGELIGDVSEATRLQTSMSRSDYLFTEFRVIVTYLRLLFLPINQNLDYDYPVYSSFINPEVLLSFFLLAAVFGSGVYLYCRYRNSIPHTRLISFGIFWFFITLSVESSLIPIDDVIFEHRMYLPSIGAFLAVVSALFLTVNTINTKLIQLSVSVFFIIVILIFSTATYKRNEVWNSEIRLWEDVANKSPNKSRGHNNLGNAYLAQGLRDKAFKHYTTAIQLKPDYAEAHYNLGSLYGKEGNTDKAIKHLLTALTINPDMTAAHNNLGNIYLLSNSFIKANEYYLRAYNSDNNNFQTLYNLALTSEKLKQPGKALQYYEIFLDNAPFEYSYLFSEINKRITAIKASESKR